LLYYLDCANNVAGCKPLPALSDRDLSEVERDQQASLVKERQEMLANAFRDSMTTGQSFEAANQYRQGFFEEVIEIANKACFLGSLPF
jgi:hypothetical protein